MKLYHKYIYILLYICINKSDISIVNPTSFFHHGGPAAQPPSAKVPTTAGRRDKTTPQAAQWDGAGLPPRPEQINRKL